MKTKVRMGARKLRAVLRRRWARVALVVLALIGVAGATFWTAHHVSDSVTITVTYYGSPDGDGKATPTTVYTATITDPAKARAIQSLWNETGTTSPFTPYHCPQGGIPYVYSFRFSLLGVPVQELKAAQGGCGLFPLTTLGIRSLWLHGFPRRATWSQIVRLVGMPDFNAIWYTNWYQQYCKGCPSLPGK